MLVTDVQVLVHGYAAGNAFWMFVLKDLAAHFRVVCVEMYGCGRSDRLPFNAKGPAATVRSRVKYVASNEKEIESHFCVFLLFFEVIFHEKYENICFTLQMV